MNKRGTNQLFPVDHTFVWQLLPDRLPSGMEVVKRRGHGDGYAPFVVSRGLGHITSSLAMLPIFFGALYVRLWCLIGRP